MGIYAPVITKYTTSVDVIYRRYLRKRTRAAAKKKSFAVRVSRASITVLCLPQKLAYLRKYLKCGALSKILVSCYESSDDSMKEQLLPYLKRNTILGTNPDYVVSVFTLIIRLVGALVNDVPSCK